MGTYIGRGYIITSFNEGSTGTFRVTDGSGKYSVDISGGGKNYGFTYSPGKDSFTALAK